jgi:excisionase family DNA binding protein
MRSRLRSVPQGRVDRVAGLLAELAAIAPTLTVAEALDAIGRTAQLDAVLRSRLATLAAAPPPAPADARRYLDTADAADYLGVSRSTVIRLQRSGAIETCRPVESIVRFDRDALDRFMAGR